MILSSEVRDYEVDFQGIVNNAVYMNFLDHARSKYLESLGFDIVKIAQEGINIVLFETTLKFKRSLRFRDEYHIKTNLIRLSRFKLYMPQEIINTQTNTLCVEASNYLCCVNAQTGKPCMHEAFEALEITQP
ncbi:MAG TPA: acyl-CoA thioesterase [Gammaproteobacteria bacterium]|nr:acyl-CoA thioesterase [Gammaproteobacteria bacterium]